MSFYQFAPPSSRASGRRQKQDSIKSGGGFFLSVEEGAKSSRNVSTTEQSPSRPEEDPSFSSDPEEQVNSIVENATTAPEGLDRVLLKKPLVQNESKLRQVPLEALNCSFGVVKSEGYFQPLQKVVGNQVRDGASDVTIVFAVRRPGCGNCREHGQQLCELSAQDKQVSLVGVVKETGVADRELSNFYQHYFRRPIYKDSAWRVFRLMGDRKLSFGTLFKRHVLKNQRRHKKKQIENVPFGGDLYTQGGLLFYDRKGHLRFAYDEVFGEELDMEAIQAAVQCTRLINEQVYFRKDEPYRQPKKSKKKSSRSSRTNGNKVEHRRESTCTTATAACSDHSESSSSN